MNNNLPLVIDYLRTHSLNDLEREHGVDHRFSNDGRKLSLNYSQINANSDDPLACQCRGLVIRPYVKVENLDQIVGECHVLARPMDRFFNHDDPHAHHLDPRTTMIEEKLDGSCLILYYDHFAQRWCCATRSVCEADLPTNTPIGTMTFAQIFKIAVEKTLNDVHSIEWSFEDWCNTLNKDHTYVYELTSPLNRIVVRYAAHRVTLLAARETNTGRYVTNDLEGFANDNYASLLRPKTWSFNSKDELIEFVEGCDPQACEGAIMVDANFNRVKVKSKAWVVASRAKDLVKSPRMALECVIDGTMDAILPSLDECIVGHLLDTKARLEAYAKHIDSTFGRIVNEGYSTRKEFALKVKASGEWETPFFGMLAGRGIGGNLECVPGTVCPSFMTWLRSRELTPTVLDNLNQLISVSRGDGQPVQAA